MSVRYKCIVNQSQAVCVRVCVCVCVCVRARARARACVCVLHDYLCDLIHATLFFYQLSYKTLPNQFVFGAVHDPKCWAEFSQKAKRPGWISNGRQFPEISLKDWKPNLFPLPNPCQFNLFHVFQTDWDHYLPATHFPSLLSRWSDMYNGRTYLVYFDLEHFDNLHQTNHQQENFSESSVQVTRDESHLFIVIWSLSCANSSWTLVEFLFTPSSRRREKLIKGREFREPASTDPILATTEGTISEGTILFLFLFAWPSKSMRALDEKQRN